MRLGDEEQVASFAESTSSEAAPSLPPLPPRGCRAGEGDCVPLPRRAACPPVGPAPWAFHQLPFSPACSNFMAHCKR